MATAAALLAATGWLTACEPAAPAAPRRGAVLSVTPVQHLSAAAVRGVLVRDGLSTGRVRSGVDAYRLRYRTIERSGAPRTASGLLVLPTTAAQRLRIVSFTHGTMAGADEAPSVDDGGRLDEGLLFGSAGYAVAAPDYLGLGRGEGYHPYLDVASETTASLDMLRAASTVAGQHGRGVDPRVLVTGFSQGAVAAMGLGKALRDGADPRLRLAAVAPISGPYRLRDAELPAMLAGTLDGTGSAFNLGYLVASWQRTYHLFGRPGEAFRHPYDRTVAPLYDNRHDDPAIFARLPHTPDRLLTPATLAALRHPTGRLAAVLAANDATCRGWRPGVPVRLYAAGTDEQVTVANSRACVRDLAAAGVPAPVTELGRVAHLDSGHRAAGRVLAWFDRLTAAPTRPR